MSIASESPYQSQAHTPLWVDTDSIRHTHHASTPRRSPPRLLTTEPDHRADRSTNDNHINEEFSEESPDAHSIMTIGNTDGAVCSALHPIVTSRLSAHQTQLPLQTLLHDMLPRPHTIIAQHMSHPLGPTSRNEERVRASTIVNCQPMPHTSERLWITRDSHPWARLTPHCGWTTIWYHLIHVPYPFIGVQKLRTTPPRKGAPTLE